MRPGGRVRELEARGDTCSGKSVLSGQNAVFAPDGRPIGGVRVDHALVPGLTWSALCPLPIPLACLVVVVITRDLTQEKSPIRSSQRQVGGHHRTGIKRSLPCWCESL